MTTFISLHLQLLYVGRTVHKIEGYQQLTNKLQRHLNQKLLTEIGDIGTRCDTIAANLGDSNILARFDSLEQNYVQLQQEHQRLQERFSVLEGLSSRFSDEYRNNLESKLQDLSGTKERLEKTVVMIGDNKNTLNHLIEKTDKHDDTLQRLQDVKTVDTETVETLLQDMNKNIMDTLDEKNGEVNEKIAALRSAGENVKKENEECVAILFESLDKVKKDVEGNQNIVKSVQDSYTDMKGKYEGLNEDLKSSSDNILKNIDIIKNIEDRVDGLDSRTDETIERMKEVTVLANTVKVEQDKMAEENKEAMRRIGSNCDELKGLTNGLRDLRNSTEQKQLSLFENVREVGDQVDGFRNRLEEKIAAEARSLEAKVQSLEAEREETRGKVEQLEAGHSSQLARLDTLATLGSRLATAEEARQQTEARVEDTVQRGREAVEAAIEARISGLEAEVREVGQLGQLGQEVAELRRQQAELRTSVLTETEARVAEVSQQLRELGGQLREDQRQEMKRVEAQLNTIYQEYERMDKTVTDFRTQHGADMEGLAAADRSHTETMAKTEGKLTAIMEQAATLMMNDARQDETLDKVGDRLKNLETKHVSLEEADVYLQESQRQITEKSSSMEEMTKKEIEDIHQKISSLPQLKKNIGSMEERQNEHGDKISSLENHLVLAEGQIVNLEEGQADLSLKLTKDVNDLRKGDQDILDNLEQFKVETLDELQNLKNKENSWDSGFEDMLNRSTSITNNMENVEEEIRKMKESMIQLEFKTESSTVVETLSAEVGKLHDEKQSSEARTSAEIEALMAKINILEQDKEETHGKLQELDTYAQGVNTKIEELENSVEDKMSKISETSSEQFKHIETTFVSQMTESVETSIQEVKEVSREAEQRMLDLLNKDSQNQKQFEEILKSLGLTEQRVEETARKLDNFNTETALIVKKVDTQHENIESIFQDIERMSATQQELEILKESQKSQISTLGNGFDGKIENLHKLVVSFDDKLSKKFQHSGNNKLLSLILIIC